MKKIILVALAAVGLAACATEDTIVTPKGNAIAFGDAFVDNATKAIIADAGDIQDFTVFGNVNNNVALYGNGAPVTRNGAGNGEAFKCEVVRYWTPSCTFNFAAVANGTVEANDVVNGLPTKISYTVDANDPKDLIYATAAATTDNASVVTPATGCTVTNGIVGFTFNHLLSKVYFEVTHSLGNDYSIEVTNIAVSGVQLAGTYNYDNENKTWSWNKDGDTTTTLNFANGANGAELIIPVNQTLGITITYNIKFGETTISTGATKTGTIAARDYAQNTVYKIGAEIGLNKIDFTVTSLNGFNSPEVNVP